MEWRSSCPAHFSKTQYHFHTDKKFRAKKFWSCPVSCNKNIIYIHTKNLGQRSSRPAQFSVKKYIICIHMKYLGGRSSRPAQFFVIKISFTCIYVICRLSVGPYGEKLWPTSWKRSPRSQFFTIRTDRKPANNMFIFFFLQ